MKKVLIPKKSGGTRTIYVQGPREKHRYRAVGAVLTEVCEREGPPGVVHGFSPGRSPVTNAAAHAGAKYVLQMDLLDFFDHCTAELIAAGCNPNVPDVFLTSTARKAAADLAKAAIYDGAARQGLSSSPAAANVAAMPLDYAILAALPDGYTYTRYADDLTISGPELAPLLALRDRVPELAKLHGQEVKASKTRLQAAHFGRIVITGVAVDADGTHPTRAAKRKARAAAHQARLRPGWYNDAIARGHENWIKSTITTL